MPCKKPRSPEAPNCPVVGSLSALQIMYCVPIGIGGFPGGLYGAALTVIVMTSLTILMCVMFMLATFGLAGGFWLVDWTIAPINC